MNSDPDKGSIFHFIIPVVPTDQSLKPCKRTEILSETIIQTQMNYFKNNREGWNEVTPLHIESDFYDVPGFKNGKTALKHIELIEIGEVKGKSLLHLQCHFGLDTLSFARLGAQVTGIDISDTAIQAAINLSKELTIPATFYQTNLYDIERVIKGEYDIIYTSYGAINWLDDLDNWARLIAKFLKPNGLFYMVEFHPYVYTLSESMEIEESYFNTGPVESILDESYTDNSKTQKQGLRHTEWHHSISEVLNSLMNNGLQLSMFNEFPYQPYNCFKNMVKTGKEKWVFEKYKSRIPYLYSLKARKK